MVHNRAPAVAPRRGRLKVLVADDQLILREALAGVLATRGFRVVAVAENGRRAVLLARRFHPHVALLGLDMAVMGGLDAARLILRALPQTAVLFLTGNVEDHVVREGLRIGARGFFMKAQGIDDLVQALRDVTQGALYLSPLYAQALQRAFAHGAEAADPELTPRETQMLHLIAEGKSAKQAAAAMSISARTAESHRAHLMRKLHIHDTAGLVRYAIRQGLIVA